MKFIATEFPAQAKSHTLAPGRLFLLAIMVVAIYGGGILMAVWAGSQTVTAAHNGGDIPVFAWSCAFILIISGMLAVVYAFFFRPREARITDEEVALFWWDGSGKGLKRSEVKKIEKKFGKIVVSSETEKLTIPSIFVELESLEKKIAAWII